MSDFVILGAEPHPDRAVLTALRGVANPFPLTAGAPLRAALTEPLSLQMHEDWPRHTTLADTLTNTHMLWVASARLAHFLVAERHIAHLERLPVTVLDHRGAPRSEPTEIIHPVGALDVLDLDGANVSTSFILPDEIDGIDRIQLHEGLVPPDAHVFRCKNLANFIFVRRALAEEIDRAGFTGARWRELADVSL